MQMKHHTTFRIHCQYVIIHLFITHTLSLSRHNYSMRATISSKNCEMYKVYFLSHDFYIVTECQQAEWRLEHHSVS